MATNTRMTISAKTRLRAALAGLLLLVVALGPEKPEAAKSIFETFAENLAARKAAQSQPVTTATAAAGATKEVATVRPKLLEVPDETAATSGGQTRRIGSAALALLKMTSGTAESVSATVAKAGQAAAEDAKAVSLGRECDENEALLATNLFKSKDMRRLLGDEPRFIYNPEERPDPMIVPWVRRAAIYKELSSLADSFTGLGQFDKAVELYQRILQLDDPRYNAEVHAKLTAIAEKQNAKAMAVMQASHPVEERIDLPPWIHDNTTGVIVSPGREMCLVGEYMLHIGDTVPNYPDVRVATISQHKVTYQIRNRSFEVVLNNN